MIVKFKRLLSSLMPADTHNTEIDNTLAIVSLLCEVCVADEDSSAVEETIVVKTLGKLINIDQEKAAELLKEGMQGVKESNSVFDFTSQLSDLDSESRINLIKAMWEVAYADGYLDPMEEALIRKVATLIYVNHSDFIRTKLMVMPE
ncbi:TerB family tellurite resistance protein [Psychromonas sp. RZ22]|uniref:tellurite resistance TerB family protein n=1 Tax=Psychromonas algarum TaxID=2555643 RepID=UPI0010681EB1|nr:TerB family tellurite resistance protein [Psychromonas sp. RZ22]TEW55532.1 TerB family tellurite resistance protein [Psychromonas sp. RZ22]